MPADNSLRRKDPGGTAGEPSDTSVLLVLVATTGSAWLPQVIAGIAAQTYEHLDVIAVDNVSTDGSGAMLDKAFGKGSVFRLDKRVGYAKALATGLKAAGDRAVGAHAFLFLHDDCVMEPETLTSLVETLGYEAVGIAGPKLVEWDNDEVLLEAGLSIDRYGRTFDPLERGELDQGQYDRVRETMWISSACMLVSRDVIERVGFFDTRYVAFREDLDLCWRARVAGFKVAFDGLCRARHAAASVNNVREGFTHNRARYFIERNLLASVLKNYSGVKLLTAAPMAIMLALGSALVSLISGRRREAGQIFEAVRWNLGHLPSTARARRRSQRVRSVSDDEIMRHAAKGASRFRALAERAFERVAGDPALGLEEAEGLATPGQRTKRTWRDRIRAHPLGAAVVVLTILYLIGSRVLFQSGGIAGTDMPPFPSSSSRLLQSFFSGWRTAGTGSAGAAPTGHLVAGLLSFLTFGSTALAQRLIIVALVPIAGLSASRLARHLGCSTGPRRVAAFAYALSPVALWALGEGRLSDLVLLAAAPGLCVPFVRMLGLSPWNGWRDLVVPALGCAFAATFSPWVIIYVLLAGASFSIGSVLTGRRDRAPAVAGMALALAASALVLLFPWSLELLRHGSAFGLGGALDGSRMDGLLRLTPPGVHAIPLILASAFPLAAAAGFAIAPREHDRTVRLVAIAGAIGLTLAWAVGRGAPWIAPRSSLPLALYAVCVCVLIGFGAEGIRPTLTGRQFGASQIGIALVTLAVVVATAAGGVWLVGGSRPGLRRSGALAPAFLEADRLAFGDYRILWASGSATDVRAALSGSAGDTMVTYAERRAGAGQDAIDRVVAGIAAGTVDSAGRQLAPFGVRYVFVRNADPSLIAAFQRQTDLRFYQRFDVSSVFANDAWLPVAVSVNANGWSLASRATGASTVAAIAGAEPNAQRGDGFQRNSNDIFAGSVRDGAKRVLLATTFDPRWKLRLAASNKTASNKSVPAERSFGWATGFAAAGPGRALMVWTGQDLYRMLLVVQLLIWLLLAVVLSRHVAAVRGER